MVNQGQYDPMEEASETSVMHSFQGSSTVYSWLLDQEEFLINFEQTGDTDNIAAALICSSQSDASKCLEAVFTHMSNLSNPLGILTQEAAFDLKYVADNVDFPNRIGVLWDAGADFHTPSPYWGSETTLDSLFSGAMAYSSRARNSHNKYGAERQSIPTPPLRSIEDVIEYDRLEDTVNIKSRSRTPRYLWQTWYPGEELSILEVLQRYLDAWMEVLLEAGLDIVDYGRREDRLRPEGLLLFGYGQARICFEYGDHVSGCRIHVTEIWRYDPERKVHDVDSEEKAISAESPKMPGRWDFEDE